MSTAPNAPNWRDDVAITYDLFTVGPVIDCSNSIARKTGTWTTKTVWAEWYGPGDVRDITTELTGGGYTIEDISSPSKPQEEIDLMNFTITARKRTGTG